MQHGKLLPAQGQHCRPELAARLQSAELPTTLGDHLVLCRWHHVYQAGKILGRLQLLSWVKELVSQIDQGRVEGRYGLPITLQILKRSQVKGHILRQSVTARRCWRGLPSANDSADRKHGLFGDLGLSCGSETRGEILVGFCTSICLQNGATAALTVYISRASMPKTPHMKRQLKQAKTEFALHRTTSYPPAAPSVWHLSRVDSL